MNSTLGRLLLAALILTTANLAPSQDLKSAVDHQRSPRNQVYQFMAAATNGAVAYLWIPEHCPKLRGILVFNHNVPEGLIAGHSAVRKACAENQLGIVYAVPIFYHGRMEDFGNPTETHSDDTRQFGRLLETLAQKSDYPEVATVPWLPIGESMSLLMVRGLLNEFPERCIAGIFVCDISYAQDRTVPILGLQGTGIEWGQTKEDLRKRWIKTSQERYREICKFRKESPGWPASLYVEAGGGHFNCSETMIRYLAGYIDRVVKARLSDDGSPRLKPVAMTRGVLAHLPVPGSDNLGIESAAPAADPARPWYFDRADAIQAQAIAAVDWAAATRLPLVQAGEHAVVKPWANNSVTAVQAGTESKFSLQPVFLDKIPEGFVGAGEALSTAGPLPVIQWTCGAIAPLGDNRFCVELDRTYIRGHASGVLTVVAEATPTARQSVQPLLVTVWENTQGAAQEIDFKKISDVPAGTPSVPLTATAGSQLPVKFYVQAGPAIVEQDRLVFTPVPPKAQYPVAVTVVAWQWGSPGKFKKAVAQQTFNLVQ